MRGREWLLPIYPTYRFFASPHPEKVAHTVPIEEYMLNQALSGRIYAGRDKKGDAPETITLTITGRFAYEMQQFLQTEACKGGDYPRVRFLVMLSEQLANAVNEARERITHQHLVDPLLVRGRRGKMVARADTPLGIVKETPKIGN
jgi:hypothetical protein